MGKIMLVRYLEDESYHCYSCDLDLEEENIHKPNWQCKVCNEKVHISTSQVNAGVKRKMPGEVKVGDQFLMHTGTFHEVYEVKKKKDVYYYKLQEYGGHEQHGNVIVNCMY